jgi:hypothetical protein
MTIYPLVEIGLPIAGPHARAATVREIALAGERLGFHGPSVPAADATVGSTGRGFADVRDPGPRQCPFVDRLSRKWRRCPSNKPWRNAMSQRTIGNLG